MTIALESIIHDLKSDATRYTLTLNDVRYTLENVDVIQIDTPTRRPTARGNVYLEDSRSYRIKANIQNDVVPYLSVMMLGPSKEFGGLHIVAQTASSDSFNILGSLLNIISVKGLVTLSISIVSLVRIQN